MFVTLNPDSVLPFNIWKWFRVDNLSYGKKTLVLQGHERVLKLSSCFPLKKLQPESVLKQGQLGNGLLKNRDADLGVERMQ